MQSVFPGGQHPGSRQIWARRRFGPVILASSLWAYCRTVACARRGAPLFRGFRQSAGCSLEPPSPSPTATQSSSQAPPDCPFGKRLPPQGFLPWGRVSLASVHPSAYHAQVVCIPTLSDNRGAVVAAVESGCTVIAADEDHSVIDDIVGELSRLEETPTLSIRKTGERLRPWRNEPRFFALGLACRRVVLFFLPIRTGEDGPVARNSNVTRYTSELPKAAVRYCCGTSPESDHYRSSSSYIYVFTTTTLPVTSK